MTIFRNTIQRHNHIITVSVDIAGSNKKADTGKPFRVTHSSCDWHVRRIGVKLIR